MARPPFATAVLERSRRIARARYSVHEPEARDEEMSPRKKPRRPRAPQKIPEDPLELVSRAREGAADGLRPTGEEGASNRNVGQNVREIRAILATNAEIFDRCMGSMVCPESDDSVVAAAGDDPGEEGGRSVGGPGVKFSRVGFESVRTVYDEDVEATQFLARPERSETSIDMGDLMEPPADLGGIIVVGRMAEPFSMFVDCESFFERSLLLHEDVLGPFLSKLKGWLMSVQVCLGRVDGWVMGPQRVADFLEETFGKRLHIPNDCPEGPQSESDDSDLDDGFSSLMARGYQLLGEFSREDSSGKLALHFDVAEEGGRRRLEKILEFLAME